MRPREQSSSSMNTSDISMFNSFLAGEIYTDASLLPFQCAVLSADMPIPVVEMPVIASQNVSRRPDEIYEMQPQIIQQEMSSQVIPSFRPRVAQPEPSARFGSLICRCAASWVLHRVMPAPVKVIIWVPLTDKPKGSERKELIYTFVLAKFDFDFGF